VGTFRVTIGKDTGRARPASPDGRLRIASYPDRNPGNPYVELFYRALAQHGIDHAGRLVASDDWLETDGKDVHVVHIHWPERMWRGRRAGRLDHALALITARSVRGVCRLKRFLDRAGARGMTRVWTVHNLAHHEGATWVDRWGYRQLARRSDLLLCFSHAAATELRHLYGASTPILVLSHGSYLGAYPPSSSRTQARTTFGLRTDVPVVSCLGLLRPYKGIELACEAVEALGGRVQFLIAGQPMGGFDLDGLQARAGASGGTIRVWPRALTDEEFSAAMAASDAVLLPYRAVTGSGVLFAAWTMGAGVIASDLPFFSEMLSGEPMRGRTFRAGDSADLARVIESYLGVPAEHRRQAVLHAVVELSPDRVVVPFVEALGGRHADFRAGVTVERN
jgi:beta-1,4-mannosyltransferase